ncbi:MAG: P1 family peptidase [Acidobacteria bacterium]|nr:P1 family peptidase [Acidobacteriota bacterium]
MATWSRREFQKALSWAVLSPLTQGNLEQGAGSKEVSAGRAAAAGSLTDVEGLKVGHFTDQRRPTGCTVVLAEKGAVAGVDVRGSAPGTRETDLLNPIHSVQQIYAVLLAGGSAFGLEASAGVMQYLEEKGVGFETEVAKVPIVPAAILFDLGVGNPKIRPDKASGYAACRNASAGSVKEGNVGAGAGATVGKLLGIGRAMKAGLGTASIQVGDLVIAALAAVNAAGDIYDSKTGKIVAGARTADGKKLANTIETMKSTPVDWAGKKSAAGIGGQTTIPNSRAGSGGTATVREWWGQILPTTIESTTLGIVATNAAFDKAAMTKIAQMAHDGYARAINPVHTPQDGDTIFALSTGIIPGGSGTSAASAHIGLVGALAAEVMAQAILRAAFMADGIPNFPAARDLR